MSLKFLSLPTLSDFFGAKLNWTSLIEVIRPFFELLYRKNYFEMCIWHIYIYIYIHLYVQSIPESTNTFFGEMLNWKSLIRAIRAIFELSRVEKSTGARLGPSQNAQVWGGPQLGTPVSPRWAVVWAVTLRPTNAQIGGNCLGPRWAIFFTPD